MAAAPQGAPQGASPQGGGAPSGALVQILGQIGKLASMLGQVFPAGSEEADGINQLVQKVQSKAAQTVSPAQPQAPPI